MQINKFYGDQEHTFALTDEMITELERVTGKGIGAIYQSVIGMKFSLFEITETIRLGLIGGGMSPEQAKTLTKVYGTNRPIHEVFPLALDIIDARWGAPIEEAV